MFFPHAGIRPARFVCWYVPAASVTASVHSAKPPSRSEHLSKQQLVSVIDGPHSGTVP